MLKYLFFSATIAFAALMSSAPKAQERTREKTQQQRPAIFVVSDSVEEWDRLIKLLYSSLPVDRSELPVVDVQASRLTEKSRNGLAALRTEAKEDIKVLQRFVTSGQAGDYAATMLAVRQTPFVGPDGEDNIREISGALSRIAIKTTDPKIGVVSFCSFANNCNIERLRLDEMILATGGAPRGTPALPTMAPNRGIPVTRPAAAINGFLDAQMNTHRYLGKKPSGEILTLPQTVADMQTRTSASTTNEQLESCMANENTYSISQCAIAGARAGITFKNDTGVNYDGARFLGFMPQASAQRR
jgi:hypothetical protein